MERRGWGRQLRAINRFIMCGKERNNIPLLRSVAGSRHSAVPVKKDYMIANDDMRRSMHTYLRDGGQLDIEAIQVKKSGLAGTDDQVVYLTQMISSTSSSLNGLIYPTKKLAHLSMYGWNIE